MFKPKGVMFLTLAIMLMGFSCSGPESDQPLLTAEVPLHLEDHLEAARIEGSEVPEDIPEPVVWRFDEPQPDWKPAIPINQTTKPVKAIRTEDALRVILNESNFNPNKKPRGGIYIDLPGWHREHWAYVLVQARTSEKIQDFGIGFNLREQPASPPSYPWPFRHGSEDVPVITDGSVHTYLIRTEYTLGEKWEGLWQQLGIWFAASEPASIDILSVSVIPKEAIFADAPTGVSTEVRSNAYRRTLYIHAPGRLEYKVRVPKAGRLDVGLGVLQEDVPVTFRVSASLEGGEAEILLEEIYAEQALWAQHSVDLSSMSGQVVTLALEADAERVGSVALWSAPTLTGTRSIKKPNIIFYVIDGAGADWMSVYGYNRRTTPFLEELAREGALFEHAYSNGTWTKVSNPSFMTSLLYSVLGGLRYWSDKIPEGVTTMAEHFGRSGYSTAVITSNPFAVTMSGLERGVDEVRVIEPQVNAESSQYLHRAFWEWREAYPGEPYWVHFQTTDVHEPFRPTAPFSGLFITPELRTRYIEWDKAIAQAGGFQNSAAYDLAGTTIEQHALAQQALYDEGMAHQDYQLRQFIGRLRATGEWENTLFIVASDHGYPAGSHRFNPGMAWDAPFIHPFATRIPLIFVWPGHIESGLRFTEPVSMLDVLPTLLDLVGLSWTEVMQGQSLAPLLLGTGEWEPTPVIVDMLSVEYETGQLVGSLEVIDGRWGASLVINLVTPGEAPPNRGKPGDGLMEDAPFTRTESLVVYDLWNDPLLTTPINAERPDLVKKFRTLLEEQFKANEMLQEQIGGGGTVELTPEQLRILRSLGYIK